MTLQIYSVHQTSLSFWSKTCIPVSLSLQKGGNREKPERWRRTLLDVGYSCVQQHFEWKLPLTRVEKNCDQQLAVMLSYIHEFVGEESMTDHTAKKDN